MGEENPSGYVKRKFRRTHFKLCSKWENQFLLGIKGKVERKEITTKDLKGGILKLLNTYILNFNNYWYSSYKPRYEMFGKKSPVVIVKEDWKEEIEAGTIHVSFIEKYMGAYDVSKAYSLMRSSDYASVLNASIMMRENKFDFAADSIRLISDNYLREFYDFLDPTISGRIGNGTIDLFSELL